ncbi:REST corepressor 3, partial [Aphelenchoides avenae]
MGDGAGPSGHRTPSPQATTRAYKTRSASKANESDRSDTSNRASQLQPVRNPLIRIGSDFQVKNDQLDESDATHSEDYPDRDDTVWLPSAKKRDSDLQKFCDYALTTRKLREDHALYLLMKCDYDIEEAKRQVDQRRCLDEEWTDEDKEIFRNTFPVFKKDFHRLAKM